MSYDSSPELFCTVKGQGESSIYAGVTVRGDVWSASVGEGVSAGMWVLTVQLSDPQWEGKEPWEWRSVEIATVWSLDNRDGSGTVPFFMFSCQMLSFSAPNKEYFLW